MKPLAKSHSEASNAFGAEKDLNSCAALNVELLEEVDCNLRRDRKGSPYGNGSMLFLEGDIPNVIPD